jgi:hypothetical protein
MTTQYENGFSGLCFELHRVNSGTKGSNKHDFARESESDKMYLTVQP